MVESKFMFGKDTSKSESYDTNQDSITFRYSLIIGIKCSAQYKVSMSSRSIHKLSSRPLHILSSRPKWRDLNSIQLANNTFFNFARNDKNVAYLEQNRHVFSKISFMSSQSQSKEQYNIRIAA